MITEQQIKIWENNPKLLVGIYFKKLSTKILHIFSLEKDIFCYKVFFMSNTYYHNQIHIKGMINWIEREKYELNTGVFKTIVI